MYYKEDYKTTFQDDSNEDFIILSHIVEKLWRINHFRAKFKRPAKKYYRRRDTKAGFKRPRWRVKLSNRILQEFELVGWAAEMEWQIFSRYSPEDWMLTLPSRKYMQTHVPCL
jgi:hypothetical protein